MSGFPYSGVTCVVCDHTATAVCYDCGLQAFFCDEHIEVFHSSKINTFHIYHKSARYGKFSFIYSTVNTNPFMQDGLLQPYAFKKQFNLPMVIHSCSSPCAYTKEVVCVDRNGKM